MNYLYSMIIGYGFGCIQAAFLLSKFLLKEDIRSKGNGNAGASNMTVAYGKKFGLAVALIDILKASLALIVIQNLFANHHHLNNLIYIAGLFAIMGHNFPFYMGFKGGKGTASLVGILFGLNITMGVLGVLIMLIATFISDYIVIGTISLLVSFIVMTYFMNYGMAPLIISIIICLLSLYKHKKNIIDIAQGNERSVRASLSKKKAGPKNDTEK